MDRASVRPPIPGQRARQQQNRAAAGDAHRRLHDTRADCIMRSNILVNCGGLVTWLRMWWTARHGVDAGRRRSAPDRRQVRASLVLLVVVVVVVQPLSVIVPGLAWVVPGITGLLPELVHGLAWVTRPGLVAGLAGVFVAVAPSRLQSDADCVVATRTRRRPTPAPGQSSPGGFLLAVASGAFLRGLTSTYTVGTA